MKLVTAVVASMLLLPWVAADTYICQSHSGCTTQRIKDDGTLGPEITYKHGERAVLNDGDYKLSEGWVREGDKES